MPRPLLVHPINKEDSFSRGYSLIQKFCLRNRVDCPEVTPFQFEEWYFDACAYYRPDPGICICISKCQNPCSEFNSRNWSWPGNTVDRTPYGVLAHELGHHFDRETGDNKFSYFSEFGREVLEKSQEPKLTNYCPNLAEWFAEMFRLFVTNPSLLSKLRPTTFSILVKRWKPLAHLDWRYSLGSNCPARVIKSIRNKLNA